MVTIFKEFEPQISCTENEEFMQTYSGAAAARRTRAGALGLPGDSSPWRLCLYFLIKSIRTAWCPIFFTSCWTIRSLSARRAAPLTSSSGKKKKERVYMPAWKSTAKHDILSKKKNYFWCYKDHLHLSSGVIKCSVFLKIEHWYCTIPNWYLRKY